MGKTILESGLRDRDIQVLNLVREGKVISNPRKARELFAGDKLLCYGKLESMRSFVPERPKRKKRQAPKQLEGQRDEILERMSTTPEANGPLDD